MPNERIGVLLLAYGTPETPEQVASYFTHIRGGRTPSPEAIVHLEARYRSVGGRTPLLDITRSVARELEAQLGEGYRTYIGMKHWHPFIADTVEQMATDGIGRIVAIVLAPHYSRMSIGGYRKALDEANARLATPMRVDFVSSWHLFPPFVDMMARRVREALDAFADGPPVSVIFSAHSLPVRIREWNDPYESQLHASCAAVAECLGLTAWRFAWQSAGGTSEPWLGPDILEMLETVHAEGARQVLSVPIGFVSDHLEILYDIDREAQAKASTLGVTLHRTAMPNDSAEFVGVLATLVDAVELGDVPVNQTPA
jgi:protoporphyrin/coproporphyrin ferrochelatase